VGRATALLTPRAAAAAALFVALVVYDELSTHLWHAGIWWAVAWIALVLMPAVFLLVFLALPLSRSRPLPLLGTGAAFAVLAAVLTAVDANVFANFARLGATTFLGWWFLTLFEDLSWVALVASIIPWIDAYSVWRGPTKTITRNHPHVFDVLSYAFPVPGSIASFQLGVPDLLFFALFLAAADRFGLRVLSTWATILALLGATMAITIWADIDGLPALPAIALGFLAPNADLIWRSLRPGSTRAVRAP
jgi:hypothetical protein